MAGFANLSANLNLNIQNFSRNLRTAFNQMNAFARTLNGQAVSGMAQLNKHTTAWGLNMKSISRVVSGILISQAFYKMAQSVYSATSAVWDFTKQLEFAQIAYSNLFSDTSLAAEFVNVLKDFAAKTPFSFTESEKAAKRLLAYGIEYKNVMYVMQGVLSAAAIQGDSTKIESISRALGQIYTYGKLMTQEVRQLSEAGIPAYEILQEELGLTQEQLRNLGNEAIPASVAINALIDGIQKRFGNATVAATKTINGILNNISDNATMLFAGLMEPLTRFIKSALSVFGDFMFKLRDIFELEGAGGVFETLFPPELHAVLRQFVANFGALWTAIMRLVVAVGGLLKPAFMAFIQVFNAFAPVISAVANILAEIVYVITSNAEAMKILTTALATAAAMWVVFKLKALAASVVSAVIVGIGKALSGLATMLTFVLAHPFWALLIGLGGVLVGISGGFSNLSKNVNNFFKQLTRFNGIDPDKVLLPSQKERANDLSKFNKRLEGTADAMDGLADSTGKATKAAKGLLSFDEVFKLKQPDEGTDSGIEDPGIEIPDFGFGEGFMPEVPDFSDYMKLFSESFLSKLKDAWDKIKEKIPDIAELAIGAGIGFLIGRIAGGPIGGVIGLLVGAIVGYFWNKLADAFNLTPEQRVKAGIISGVGAGLGAAFGFVLGGPLGAKIGLIVGGIVGSFWGIFSEAIGVAPEQHISTALSGAFTGILVAAGTLFSSIAGNTLTPSISGALSGALKQGIVGAIVGLGVGMLSNALTAWINTELEHTDEDLKNASTGQTIGSIIGTITGLILGGPMGSLVGGSLGQLAGSVLGEFWNYMNTTLKGTVIGGAAGLPTGALVGTLVGSIGGPLGMALGGAIGAAIGALIGFIVDSWDEITKFFSDVGTAIGKFFSDIGKWFSGLGKWFTELGGSIAKVFGDIWTAISGFFGDIWDFLSQFFEIFGILWEGLSDLAGIIGEAFDGLMEILAPIGEAIWTTISEWFGGLIEDVSEWFSGIWTSISEWFGGLIEDVSAWFNDIWLFLSGWASDALENFNLWFDDIWTSISDWFGGLIEDVSAWFNEIWLFLSDWASEALENFNLWFDEIWTAISEWFGGLIEDISAWFNEIWLFLSGWASDALENFNLWFDDIWTTISDWFGGLVEDVSSWFNDIWLEVSGWASDMFESIDKWFDEVFKSISDWFGGLAEDVYNWLADVFNIDVHFEDLLEDLGGWFSDLWDALTGWLGDIGKKVSDWWDGLWGDKTAKVDVSGSVSTSGLGGHASGGIFNREHVARFSENNKAEAIIPLEENSAMQPFVDAVSNGLTASLAPLLANINFSSQSSLQPLYVGTLIADERGLKELERKMEVIRLQEGKR